MKEIKNIRIVFNDIDSPVGQNKVVRKEINEDGEVVEVHEINLKRIHDMPYNNISELDSVERIGKILTCNNLDELRYLCGEDLKDIVYMVEEELREEYNIV